MGNSPKNDEEVMIKGEIEKKDMSHIISVLQVLYHIPDFKKYFIQKEYNPNNNKDLSIFMDKLVSNQLDQIDFYNEAANVSKILRKYNLKSAETSGEILIQILMVLKYEEKEMKTENWQEYVVKNPSLFNKISNNKSALDDILDLNRDHFNTTFCASFFGIFCAERNFFETNNILYFYNFYCVYELNMPQIYQNLISKGKIMQNGDQLPQVNLIDCLYEMQEPHNETFNNYNCSVKYYMFNAPNILKILMMKEICIGFLGLMVLSLWLMLSAKSGGLHVEVLSMIAGVSIWEATNLAIIQHPALYKVKKEFEYLQNAEIHISDPVSRGGPSE